MLRLDSRDDYHEHTAQRYTVHLAWLHLRQRCPVRISMVLLLHHKVNHNSSHIQ